MDRLKCPHKYKCLHNKVHQGLVHTRIERQEHTDTLTVDVVVDLSSVVQQPEFIAAHHLPGLCISQLVTAGKQHAHSESIRKRAGAKLNLIHIYMNVLH